MHRHNFRSCVLWEFSRGIVAFCGLKQHRFGNHRSEGEPFPDSGRSGERFLTHSRSFTRKPAMMTSFQRIKKSTTEHLGAAQFNRPPRTANRHGFSPPFTGSPRLLFPVPACRSQPRWPLAGLCQDTRIEYLLSTCLPLLICTNSAFAQHSLPSCHFPREP